MSKVTIEQQLDSATPLSATITEALTASLSDPTCALTYGYNEAAGGSWHFVKVNANGHLYTVLADQDIELSANTYGYGPTGWVPISADTEGKLYTVLASAAPVSAVVPSGGSVWDYVVIGYNSSNAITAVEYKQGGSAGTTVLSMGLGYDGSSNLSSVTKASVV